jgi:hypothetical protein
VRQHADLVHRRIIEPALQKVGYDPKRIDQEGGAGNLTEKIIGRLRTARLCVSVLTGLNANVLYEVGIRQAWDLPHVPLAERGTPLPFDLKDCATVFYSLQSEKEIALAVRRLAAQVEEIETKLQRATSRTPPRMIAAFGEAMAVLGRAYSFDPLFTEKLDALKRLLERLRRMKHEMGRDYQLDNPASKPLSSHAELLDDELNDLAAKISVVERIVLNTQHLDVPRVQCDGLLEQMKSLQSKGWQLIRSWKKAKGMRRDFQEAIRQMDGLIAFAHALAHKSL